MDKVRLRLDGDDYWIEGGDFADILDVVRAVPGRRFDPDEKVWLLTGTPGQVARTVRPFRLMYEDDEPLADSTPVQVPPDP